MAVGALEHELMIALVGLLVGAGSTWSGLGAGLALPALAMLGLPLSATLLAVKLPVAASDLAAGFLPARAQHAADAAPSRGALALALLAGALAALALLRLPRELAMSGVVALALWAWRASAARGAGPQGVLAWSGYIGACGVGAGWLRRASAWQRGEDWRFGERAARQVAACANVGAVFVLVAAGQGAEGRIAVLALAQAVGAWAAVAWRGRAPAAAPAAPAAPAATARSS